MMTTFTNTTSNSLRFPASLIKSDKVNNYFVRPLKAGCIGFATILLVVFIINLLSFVTTASETFGMDYLDLLLASVGFFLQTTGTLLKSFGR